MGVREPLDVPVAMIVYKRLDKTKQSFADVRSVAPKKLYIIAVLLYIVFKIMAQQRRLSARL